MKEIESILNNMNIKWKKEVDTRSIIVYFAKAVDNSWVTITYNKKKKISILNFENMFETGVSNNNIRGSILANI